MSRVHIEIRISQSSFDMMKEANHHLIIERWSYYKPVNSSQIKTQHAPFHGFHDDCVSFAFLSHCQWRACVSRTGPLIKLIKFFVRDKGCPGSTRTKQARTHKDGQKNRTRQWCTRHIEDIEITLSVNSFYTPVFRRDVLWYGAVRPSVRPFVRPSDC